MIAIMQSIRPKWCEMIASGEKTLEIRKTRPKMDPPFKCYIYCTKPKTEVLQFVHDGDDLYGYTYHGPAFPIGPYKDVNTTMKIWGKWGKVIGEYVCDNIIAYEPLIGFSETRSCFSLRTMSCLEAKELWKYSKGGWLYGWHISDLVIYDEPKKLSEFVLPVFDDVYNEWEHYAIAGVNCGEPPNVDDYRLKRPPQSWQYCEYRGGEQT